MRSDQRRFIHIGINYIVVPAFEINQQKGLEFYSGLLAAGIECSNFAPEQNAIKIQRKPPFPLEILITSQVSPVQPIGQLLVLASQPNRSLANFAAEVQLIVETFDAVWPAPSRQIAACDVTLRCLYPSSSEHAFQEIWEAKLCQPPNLAEKLGRRVLGGGLRFVMPPQPEDPEPTQVELKIESFLNDTKMIFVEMQFAWIEPKPPGTPFDPAHRLEEAECYIVDRVQTFMRSE